MAKASTSKKGDNTGLIVGAVVIGLAATGYAVYKGNKVYNAVKNLDVTISQVKSISFDLNVPPIIKIPIVFDIKNPSSESATVAKIYGTIIFGSDQLGTFSTTGAAITIAPGKTSQVTVTVSLSFTRTLQVLQVSSSMVLNRFKNFSLTDFLHLTGGRSTGNDLPFTLDSVLKGSTEQSSLNNIKPLFSDGFRFGKDITINAVIQLPSGIEIPVSKTVSI